MKRGSRSTLKEKLPWLFAIILITVIYFLLNVSNERVIITKIFFDNYIPFIPAFVIVYIFFYVFMFGTVIYSFLKHKKDDFKLLALSIIIANIVAYIIYFFFQTKDIRPLLLSTGIFSSILSIIYHIDNVYNSFPSGHAYLTTVIALYWLNDMKEHQKILITSLSVLIVASTLFVKQHFILDSLSGIALGAISFFVIKALIYKRKK